MCERRVDCAWAHPTRRVGVREQIFRHVQEFTGSSWQFSVEDWDGSGTLSGEPTWVGSNLDWWHRGPDCRFDDEWQVWLCPAVENVSVVHANVFMPGFRCVRGVFRCCRVRIARHDLAPAVAATTLYQAATHPGFTMGIGQPCPAAPIGPCR